MNVVFVTICLFSFWGLDARGVEPAEPLCAALAIDDVDPAVQAGREALDRSWWRSYPWYDASTDSARPVDVSEPWYMKLRFWDDWKWPDWQWSPSVPWRIDSLLEWVAWIGLALLLALLIWLMVRAYRMRGRSTTKRQTITATSNEADDRRRVEALPNAGPRWPADLLAEAGRLYREGDYRGAIIFLFGHQLIELDKHHLIRLTKGKTNRQYLRELGRRPTLVALVTGTMVAFEDVFFGNHAIDRMRFESCWNKLDEFDSLLAEAAP